MKRKVEVTSYVEGIFRRNICLLALALSVLLISLNVFSHPLKINHVMTSANSEYCIQSEAVSNRF